MGISNQVYSKTYFDCIFKRVYFKKENPGPGQRPAPGTVERNKIPETPKMTKKCR
jgi:hypothetical protein